MIIFLASRVDQTNAIRILKRCNQRVYLLSLFLYINQIDISILPIDESSKCPSIYKQANVYCTHRIFSPQILLTQNKVEKYWFKQNFQKGGGQDYLKQASPISIMWPGPIIEIGPGPINDMRQDPKFAMWVGPITDMRPYLI